MIKTETITIGEKQFIRTYSDRGMMIHGGVPEADYSEAMLYSGGHCTFTAIEGSQYE